LEEDAARTAQMKAATAVQAIVARGADDGEDSGHLIPLQDAA